MRWSDVVGLNESALCRLDAFLIKKEPDKAFSLNVRTVECFVVDRAAVGRFPKFVYLNEFVNDILSLLDFGRCFRILAFAIILSLFFRYNHVVTRRHYVGRKPIDNRLGVRIRLVSVSG